MQCKVEGWLGETVNRYVRSIATYSIRRFLSVLKLHQRRLAQVGFPFSSSFAFSRPLLPLCFFFPPFSNCFIFSTSQRLLSFGQYFLFNLLEILNLIRRTREFRSDIPDALFCLTLDRNSERTSSLHHFLTSSIGYQKLEHNIFW